jgi:preprotein translocase subunit YajC
MKEATTAIMSESSRYGLLVMVLISIIMALGTFIYLIWKQIMKDKKEEKEELMDLIKENSRVITQHTTILTQLQATINTLISKL